MTLPSYVDKAKRGDPEDAEYSCSVTEGDGDGDLPIIMSVTQKTVCVYPTQACELRIKR